MVNSEINSAETIKRRTEKVTAISVRDFLICREFAKLTRHKIKRGKIKAALCKKFRVGSATLNSILFSKDRKLSENVEIKIKRLLKPGKA